MKLLILILLLPVFATAQRQWKGNWQFPDSLTVVGNFKYTKGSSLNGKVLTSDASGNASWATPGSVTPAALTKTDDTNVTLTLGGTPSTALLQAASITVGWAGTLGISRGGTGLGTTPTNGKLLIGNGTNYTLANLTSTDGTVTVTNGAGTIDLSVTNNSIVSSNQVSGATATVASLVTYTTPNDWIRVYDVSAMITVTAVSAGVLTTTLTYTDETSASRTISFFGMGATSAGLTTTGKSNFPIAGEIHCAPNTAITVTVTLTVGTATFNAGGTIRYIRSIPL